MDEKEIEVPRPKKQPVREPKQSQFGTSLNFVPSTTKWAISLRNVGTTSKDPYGKPALSVVLNHHEQGAEKAAKGLLVRIAQKYGADKDDKVFATINAFKGHVPHPSLDDYKQLDEVLHRHAVRVSRKTRSRTQMAKNSRTMPQLRLASPTPMTSAPATRKPVSVRRDVRKDEWYDLSMLQDIEVQERDRRDRKNFEIHAQAMRKDLQVQEKYLEAEEERKLQYLRDVAKEEREKHLAMLQEDKRLKEEKIKSQMEEKNRAAIARREAVDRQRRIAETKKAEEKLEVKRTLELIQQDIQKKADTMAANKRDAEMTKLFNLQEDERKKIQIAKEVAKDKKAIKEYEEQLNKRALARKAEEEQRLFKMDQMAAVAELKHKEGMLEDAEIERRAAEVQKLWARKRDEEEARQAEAKRAGLKASLDYIVVQQRELKEMDLERKNISKAEAVLAKQAHQQAEKDEEERVRKLRAQNAAHRKEIEAQMRSMHQYLLDGCEGWERGMTEFERKYNAEALAKAKRLKAAGMLRV